jgi:hypothetical protein
MDAKERKKILSIINKIEKLKEELLVLVGNDQVQDKNKSGPDNVSIFVKNISKMSIAGMEKQLNEFSHKELGNIFVEVGGSGADKRRPKAWLIERILWLSKEFIEGHKSIRDRK